MALPLVACDTETTGLDFHKGAAPFSVCFVWPGESEDYSEWPHEYFRWPVDPFTRIVTPNPKDLTRIRRILRTHRVVWHNAKFDVKALASVGVNYYWGPDNAIGSVDPDEYEDTLLASHVCDSGESHALKDLALKYLDIPDDDQKHLQSLVTKLRRKAKELLWNTADNVAEDYWLCNAAEASPDNFGVDLAREASEAVKEYNILDCARTLALWFMYREVIDEQGLKSAYMREKRLQPIVYRMEKRGVTVLRPMMERELIRYSQVCDDAEKTCQRIAYNHGFTDLQDGEELNIRSHKQLTRFLFSREESCLGLQPETLTASGNPSTDANTISSLLQRDTLPDQAEEFLLSLKEFKLNNTAVSYLSGYRENIYPDGGVIRQHGTWRMFPSFNQVGTNTTRFSSSNPNAQNIGKGKEVDGEEVDFTLRKVFGPAKYRTWYDFDYNQLQLRIFAHVAGETKLIEGFRKGYDAHDMVASEIYDMTVEELRSLPEAQYKLKRRVGKNTNFGFIFGAGPAKINATSGVKGLSKILEKRFPHATGFMDRTLREVRLRGYIETLSGYRLTVPRERAYAGVCYIVQGTEGDIVKEAMLRVARLLQYSYDSEAYMTMQVHDSIILDMPRCNKRPSDHDSKERLRFLGDVAAEMEAAGLVYGVETPVTCERVAYDWSQGEELDLTPYIQRYTNTLRNTRRKKRSLV